MWFKYRALCLHTKNCDVSQVFIAPRWLLVGCNLARVQQDEKTKEKKNYAENFERENHHCYWFNWQWIPRRYRFARWIIDNCRLPANAFKWSLLTRTFKSQLHLQQEHNFQLRRHFLFFPLQPLQHHHRLERLTVVPMVVVVVGHDILAHFSVDSMLLHHVAGNYRSAKQFFFLFALADIENWNCSTWKINHPSMIVSTKLQLVVATRFDMKISSRCYAGLNWISLEFSIYMMELDMIWR